LDQLKPLVVEILECCKEPLAHHNAVFTKYSNKKYKQVSILVRDTLAEGFNLTFPQGHGGISSYLDWSQEPKLDAVARNLDYLIQFASS
jgi:G2/mitotic-specific cyclin 3/4